MTPPIQGSFAAYEQQVRRRLLHDTSPSDGDPVAVLVVGQAGSGADTKAHLLRKELTHHRNVNDLAHLSQETARRLHPAYPRLAQAKDWTAIYAATEHDSRIAFHNAIAAARQQRLSAVIEARPEELVPLARDLLDDQYRVSVVVMAVPEAISRLNVVHRYTSLARHAPGHLTPVPLQQHAIQLLPSACATVERERLAHEVAAFSMSNGLLRHNTLDGTTGAWRQLALITAAVLDEQSRQWEPSESLAYSARVFQTRLAVDELSRQQRMPGHVGELKAELRALSKLAQQHHPQELAGGRLRRALEHGSSAETQRQVGHALSTASEQGAAGPASHHTESNPDLIAGQVAAVLGRSRDLHDRTARGVTASELGSSHAAPARDAGPNQDAGSQASLEVE